MCGIVGYIGHQNALDVIISGLEKLEYRGYDSAGVAVFGQGKVQTFRAQGKLAELKKVLLKNPPTENHLGIGHTRWATHGKPSENNAHPHTAGRVSLIHNGIVENYIELREQLKKEGRKFTSETDTEIAAHLLDKYLQDGLEPFAAIKKLCQTVRGSYAFLAIDSAHPDRILVAKNATPIVIGMGQGEVILASDITAVLGITRNVVILEDGDVAEVKVDGFTIENAGEKVERKPVTITWDPVTAQKGGYKHYMLKEIHEQGQIIAQTFRGRIEQENPKINLSEINISPEEAKKIKRVLLVGCGSAWHAAQVTKFYIESLAHLPCDVDYASEFRYRTPIFDESTLVIAISQSGETADTLAAVELVRSKARTLSICNVLGSSISRRVQDVLYTHAGPEISVASTKAFTTQIIAGYLLGLFLGQSRGTLSQGALSRKIHELLRLPVALEESLKEGQANAVEKIAKKFHKAKDFLYVARGVCYPIALEGALKLKEISYIHAEGYPAGELKHGPIALIDQNMPVVVVINKSETLFDKTLSNLREVESRGGRIIAVTDTVGNKELLDVAEEVIEVPFVSEELSPVLLNIPLQLLAYYIAVLNGTDVDLPRNLAKSVTVE